MTMRPTHALPTLLLAGLGLGLSATTARAQDSVAAATGLPGDAPAAYQAGTDSRQALKYVVDLPAKTSSWGNRYSMGPVVKSSRSNAGGFFDQLIGATAVSAKFSTGAFFGSTAASPAPYSLWTGAPGQGVNAPSNTAPATTIPAAGKFGQRFGLAFMEFGAGLDGAFGSGDDECSLVGAMVDFQNRDPGRLFVTRVVAATNKSVATGSGTASFGLGGVDENGNLHTLADGYGMTVSSRLGTRNLLRLKLAARNPTLTNQIFASGGVTSGGDTGALDVVRTTNTMMTVPAIIPATLPGGLGRPVMMATDLVTNYVFETNPNSSSVSIAYLPAGSSPRGAVTFLPRVFPPVTVPGNDAGTGATLIRTDNNTTTRAVRVFGVNTNGSPDAAGITLTLPTAATDLIDRADGFAPGTAVGPLSAHEFTNYASQASFRGSSGQVAMAVIPGGDLLVAATVAATGGGSTVPQGQDNYIAVARVPAGGGAPVWTIAAHTGTTAGYAGGQSKAILGRANPGDPLAPIGRLARYTEANPSASTGPSISSPAMDAAGNVYFVATFATPATGPAPAFSTGVFRANFDPATNAYQLELLAQLGDILPGLNSGKVYQLQSLSLADADSVDSASIFSSSLVQDQLATLPDAGTLPYGSPWTLGALALRAKIVYDMNADGQYVDPSGAGSGSNSPDQAYNAVMVIMPRVTLGDFNRSGATDLLDIFAFLNAWFASDPRADWNGNGAVDLLDIFTFLTDWFNVGNG
jgi:hypothetical protein